MAPTRKFKSGAQKRKEKERREALHKTQVGSLNKYFSSNKEEACQAVNENISEEPEQVVNDHHIEEAEEFNDHINGDVHTTNSSEEVLFDMDDPGNWNRTDQNITDFLVERGPKRDNNVIFPKDKCDRCFSSKHYFRELPNGEKQDRKWLVYSVSLDKFFCFCCKLFAKKHLVGQLADEGVNDWHNISDRLRSHESSRYHVSSMTSWMELAKRLKLKLTIDASLQEQINKEKEHWKKVLERILAVVKRLGKNNLAFRGDSEKLYEENNGLFLQMIELLAEFDSTMQEHVRRIDKHEIQYHYLSHKIQNEMIQLLAGEVKSSIISRIKEAKYFSVILDCTPDASNEEQMSLVLRSVNVSATPIVVEEYFLEFLKVADTSGLGLLNELLTALKTLGLDVNDVRGQGYDNGSNMKGKNKGVQSRLLEINRRAFYTPCACHSLNLVLSDMAHCCPKAESFFGVIQRIYSLFSASTKRWQVFTEHVPGLTVKPLSETRWESRVESVKAIRYQAPEIREALIHLVNGKEDAKTKSDVETLATYNLQNFEFLLGMIIWYELLHAVNNVSKLLQTEDMHIDTAIKELERLLSFLQKFREIGFEESLIEAKEIASEMGIEPVFMEKRTIHKKRQFDESSSEAVTQSAAESFKVNYFLYIVDQAISSFKTRFEQFKTFEENFGLLLDLDKLRSADRDSLKSFCANLTNLLKDGEISDLNEDDLYHDLRMLSQDLPNETKSAIDVLNYIKEVDGCYPNAWIAYRILLTIPVTVASAERSFSKLKLIKSYLRSTMSQERLSGLAMISIEKDIIGKLDHVSLISTFASKNARRVIFQ
ncbi:zinc finger MYM-type protein 1-like [Rosa sericea]